MVIAFTIVAAIIFFLVLWAYFERMAEAEDLRAENNKLIKDMETLQETLEKERERYLLLQRQFYSKKKGSA